MPDFRKLEIIIEKACGNFLSYQRENRYLFMGVAMMFVLFYHWYCFVNWQPLFVFKRLYIGVDIFLFVSGFGLGFSYTNNELMEFYKRRFLKVYSMYLFYAISTMLLLSSFDNLHLSVVDILCMLSTLQYYGIGGFLFEWFLSAILVLYLLYPLLFRIYNPICIVVYLLAYILFLMNHPVSWQIDCLLSRIPIFMMGIVGYKTLNGEAPMRFLIILILLFSLIIPIAYHNNLQFVYTCVFSPLLLIGMYKIFELLDDLHFDKLKNVIGFVGKNSISFYVANCLAIYTMQVLKMHTSWLYWICEFSYALMCIYVVRVFNKAFLLCKK